MPVVALGGWITFNFGNDLRTLANCTQVTRAFFAQGGHLIDCSPMYGSSEPAIGHALAQLGHPTALFSAEKVWEGDATQGPAQMETSRVHWDVPRFDLMKVHNLLAWQQQLPHLLEMKAAGRLRYVSITTSHSRRHKQLAQTMATQPIDFIPSAATLWTMGSMQRWVPADAALIALLAATLGRRNALASTTHRSVFHESTNLGY